MADSLGSHDRAASRARSRPDLAAQCRIMLDYAGFRLGVSSDHSAHLEWLEEFLAPPFETVRVDRHDCERLDCEVLLTLDDEAFERQLADGPASGSDVCFEMDTRVVRLPVWRSDQPDRVVFDEAGCVFYRVDALHRTIEILASAATSASEDMAVRIALMRAVREVAMHAAVAHGGVFLHAAGFAVDGSGVIVAGPKRTGKSTLLLFALTATPAALLSNDRLLLTYDNGDFLVRGLPTITTLRATTLDFFPAILRSLLEDGFHTGVTVAEAARSSRGHRGQVGPAPDGRFGITNRQLCQLASCEAVAQVPTTAVLFPRQRKDTETLELVQASEDEAAHQLRRSLFGRQEDRPVNPLFRLAPSPAGGYPDAAEACRALASNVPCYFCDVGPRSYELAASAEALLERLQDRRTTTTEK
jgi:hypothetical protein